MKQYLEIYRKNLFESVIPFWSKHSRDPEWGGYFTGLDRSGEVYDDTKYVWLQGRQAWLYAKLYNTVEEKDEWVEMAEQGVRFLLDHAKLPDGRVCFSLDRKGQPKSIQRKIFSECFFLMALAETFRATGNPVYRQEALELLDRLDRLIENPSLLGRPILPGNRVTRTLAVPMISLNLLEELTGVLPDDDIRNRRTSLVQQVLEHYDSVHRLFRENLDTGGLFSDLPEGRLVSPGHSIEAAWFLLHASRLGNHPEVQTIALEALLGSMEFGWDTEWGGLYYFMDVEEKPLPQLEWSMKLWWPHTEALYALVLAYTLTGDEGFEKWHERVHHYCFETFVDWERGEWFGYTDRRGERTHDLKGGAYKGCFHVPRSLLYSIEVLEER